MIWMKGIRKFKPVLIYTEDIAVGEYRAEVISKTNLQELSGIIERSGGQPDAELSIISKDGPGIVNYLDLKKEDVCFFGHDLYFSGNLESVIRGLQGSGYRVGLRGDGTDWFVMR